MAKTQQTAEMQELPKQEFKHAPNHVGYVTKSKAGNTILKVEQDIVLKKGDTLFMKSREEDSRAPEWKLATVNKIVAKDA